MGRPSTFTLEIAEEICEAIAGGAALHVLAEVKTNWPCEQTIYRWLQQHADFREMYARARERQADRLAAEIIVIADTPQEGEKVEITDRGEKIIRGDMIEHRRLQVDARKWAAAKLAPRKYSDKLMHEGGEKPIGHDHRHTVDLSKLTDDELEEANRLAAKLAASST